MYYTYRLFQLLKRFGSAEAFNQPDLDNSLSATMLAADGRELVFPILAPAATYGRRGTVAAGTYEIQVRPLSDGGCFVENFMIAHAITLDPVVQLLAGTTAALSNAAVPFSNGVGTINHAVTWDENTGGVVPSDAPGIRTLATMPSIRVRAFEMYVPPGQVWNLFGTTGAAGLFWVLRVRDVVESENPSGS